MLASIDAPPLINVWNSSNLSLLVCKSIFNANKNWIWFDLKTKWKIKRDQKNLIYCESVDKINCDHKYKLYLHNKWYITDIKRKICNRCKRFTNLECTTVQNYRCLFEICNIHNIISDILKNGEKKNCCSMHHMLKGKYKCINCKA